MQTTISLSEVFFLDLFDSIPYKYVRPLLEGVEPDEYEETMLDVTITKALPSRPLHLMQFITFTLNRFCDAHYHYGGSIVTSDEPSIEYTVEIEYLASGKISVLMTEIEERCNEENPLDIL